MEEIKIDLQYTPEDLIREIEFHTNRTNKTGWTLIFGSVFLLLLAVLTFVLSFVALNNFQFWVAVANLLSANLLFLFCFWSITKVRVQI